MKVIIDCNVIISAGLTRGVCFDVLHEILEKNYEIIYSKEILEEWVAVASRPKFKKNYKFLKKIITKLVQYSKFTEISNKNINLSDKSDEIYLQTAFAENTNFLITGNIKHFPDSEYFGVKVVTPREFLELKECLQN